MYAINPNEMSLLDRSIDQAMNISCLAPSGMPSAFGHDESTYMIGSSQINDHLNQSAVHSNLNFTKVGAPLGDQSNFDNTIVRSVNDLNCSMTAYTQQADLNSSQLYQKHSISQPMQMFALDNESRSDNSQINIKTVPSLQQLKVNS